MGDLAFQSDWLKAVAVHTGSRVGNDPKFIQNAELFSQLLVQNGFKIIYYGDGKVGTMGAMARAGVKAGAEVYGVGLDFLVEAEGGGVPGVVQRPVRSMSERMETMRINTQTNGLLPGSYGTMEEGLEWLCADNGYIKPQVICNLDGYWNGMLQFLNDAVEAGYENASLRNRFYVASSAEDTVNKLIELNAQPAIPDPAHIVLKADQHDYIQETYHALICRPMPLKPLSHLISRVVTYDLANIKGQTLFTGTVLKPVVLINEDGYYDGFKKQLKTGFKTQFSPDDRAKFFHIVDNERDARDRAAFLDSQPPLLPKDMKIKHAEAAHREHIADPSPTVASDYVPVPG